MGTEVLFDVRDLCRCSKVVDLNLEVALVHHMSD